MRHYRKSCSFCRCFLCAPILNERNHRTFSATGNSRRTSFNVEMRRREINTGAIFRASLRQRHIYARERGDNVRRRDATPFPTAFVRDVNEGGAARSQAYPLLPTNIVGRSRKTLVQSAGLHADQCVRPGTNRHCTGVRRTITLVRASSASYRAATR